MWRFGRTWRGRCSIIASGMRARWSPTTKRVVFVGFALAAILFVARAGDIVQPFVWAIIVAYILLPIVGALEHRAGFPRTLAALTVFVMLLAVIFGGGRLLLPRL